MLLEGNELNLLFNVELSSNISMLAKTKLFTITNNPIWIIRKGELIEQKADKQPIGKYADPKPFTTREFKLESGDAIYIFTDGYQDQFGGERGKKFKPANFKNLLLSIQDLPLSSQKEKIDQTIEDWKSGFEQVDDICIIGVKV